MLTQPSDLLAIVGINATIFGILIAVVAAVAVYCRQIVRETELATIQEADKINSVQYELSPYFPAYAKSPWAQNVLKSLDVERKKLSIARVEEGIISQYDIPVTDTDIDELFRYLTFLSNPLYPHETKDTDYDIGNNKYIPHDEANRGEEIMSVVNMLLQSQIFPEPIAPPPAFCKGPAKRVLFRNVEDVERWLTMVGAFVNGMKQYIAFQEYLPRTRYVNALINRDQDLMKRWKSSSILKTFGLFDPEFLLLDFRSKYEQTRVIEENVRHTYNKCLYTSKRYSSYDLLRALVMLLIVFMFGVAIPMINNSVSRCLYLYLPLVINTILLISMTFWLSRK